MPQFSQDEKNIGVSPVTTIHIIFQNKVQWGIPEGNAVV